MCDRMDPVIRFVLGSLATDSSLHLTDLNLRPKRLDRCLLPCAIELTFTRLQSSEVAAADALPSRDNPERKRNKRPVLRVSSVARRVETMA